MVGALLRPGDTLSGPRNAGDRGPSTASVRRRTGCSDLRAHRRAGDCTEVMTRYRRGRFFLTKAKMTRPVGAVALPMRLEDGRLGRRRAGRYGRSPKSIRTRGMEEDSGIRSASSPSAHGAGQRQAYHLWEGSTTRLRSSTNDIYSDADDMRARYNRRAGIEPLIGEFKSGWGIGKVSSELRREPRDAAAEAPHAQPAAPLCERAPAQAPVLASAMDSARSHPRARAPRAVPVDAGHCASRPRRCSLDCSNDTGASPIGVVGVGGGAPGAAWLTPSAQPTGHRAPVDPSRLIASCCLTSVNAVSGKISFVFR